MVTIKDIAKRAHVSVAAVSYALNDKKGVNKETKKNIHKIADEMGYIPNSLAQSLVSKSTNVLGLIIPDISNMYVATFIKYLNVAARKDDFFLLLGSTSGGLETEAQIIRKFIAKKVDCLIIVPENYHSEASYGETLRSIEKHQIPYLLTHMTFPGINAHSVLPDLEDGEYQATKYLIEQGHRKLVFVGGRRSHYYSEIRYKGFLKALRETRLPLNRTTYVHCGQHLDFQDGHDAVQRFLKTRPLPDAFVAVNDLIAYGIQKGLTEHGIRVPHDVSLVGFDDIALPLVDTVPLTTVRIPVEELARQCINVLKVERTVGDYQTIVLKTELVVRHSVKPRPWKGR